MNTIKNEVTWIWDAPSVDTLGRPITEPLSYEVDCNGVKHQTPEAQITLPVEEGRMMIVAVRASTGGTWSAWSAPASFNMPGLSINSDAVSFLAVPPAYYKLLWRASLTEGDWLVVLEGAGIGQEPTVYPLRGNAGFFKLTAQVVTA